jgi:flagellar hook-associated protein 1 FlgK
VGGNLLVGLDIARSALEAQQAVIAVTGQNVANANTPGYSEQVANLVPNPPYSPPALDQNNGPGQFGMGVTVGSITRQTSNFLNLQAWSNNSGLAANTQTAQTLDQVQALLNEPSSTGLNSSLDAFWSAWAGLADNPSDGAAQSQAVAAGQALVQQFHTLASGLAATRASLDQAVGEQVQQVNGITSQIASLNQTIMTDTAAGQNPNDLEDQRDQLVGQLSSLIPVSVTWQQNGEITVASGTVAVVDGNQSTALVATPDPANGNYLALSWAGSGVPAAFGGQGQLGALVALRDQTLPGYQASVDGLASGLAQQVNALEEAGTTPAGAPGQAYFEPASGTVSAANIALNPALVSNPALIATGGNPSGGAGDGTTAQKVADLQNSTFLSGGTQTPSDYYATFVGQVGADAAAAQSARTDAQALQQSISNQQQQVSGVSIDQEMTTMVEAQNAYGAAADLVTTINTMLGSLIQMVQ